MKLSESRHDPIHLFTLEGEIDMHYAPALRALFESKVKTRCPALVLDLSGVTFIDSTGISVLIEYLRDSAGFEGEFCLAGPTEHVRDVFEIVRLDKAVPIFNSAGEAIAALRKGRVPRPAEPFFGWPADERSTAVASAPRRKIA